MKLYITPLSPYARFVRIVVLEKGLEDRLDMAQITLVCALQYGSHILGLQWRQGPPKLTAWLDALAKWPSIAVTAPTASH